MDGASGKELQSQGGEFIHPFFMRAYFLGLNLPQRVMDYYFFIKNLNTVKKLFNRVGEYYC
ncbi:MAG: hypothetical protein CMF55_05340 [Legionellales bacterium]|nr:hypothetical protein [Legionellales bacterium]HAG61586.1 hypothetical protein [Coxiellaceae bacterium]|tara:strand:- start:105 stop:287 length:183 start_codon:yes stop_codon:yes gene_type:complete